MKLNPIPVSVPDKLESNDESIVILTFSKETKGSVEVFLDETKIKVVSIIKGIAKIDLSEYKNGQYDFTFKYLQRKVFR